jgi:hypothetical protein
MHGCCFTAAQVVARGLRVKCGVEMGKVSAEVHAVTARVTYSGRTVGLGGGGGSHVWGGGVGACGLSS